MSEEKTKTALLREELMMKEDKGIRSLSSEELAKADEFCEGYKRFLNGRILRGLQALSQCRSRRA